MTGPCYLYRLYGRSDRLLYVGITNDPQRRLAEHARSQPWWREVDQRTILIYEYGDRETACEMESLAIRTEFPAYNIVHAGGASFPPRARVRVVRERRRRRPARRRARYRRRLGLRRWVALGVVSVVMIGAERLGWVDVPLWVVCAGLVGAWGVVKLGA